MWEDVETACIRAIVDGVVDRDPPSRRRRHKVLAVDRDAGVAAVLVATRGKRHGSARTVHQFRLEHGTWQQCGAGGSGSDAAWMPDRAAVPANAVVLESSGRQGGGPRGSTVGDAVLRAGADIVVLRWRGEDRPVSPTGYAVIVWSGRRAPSVEALDAAGRVVERIDDLGVRPPIAALPWLVRLQMAIGTRRRPDEWFNHVADR